MKELIADKIRRLGYSITEEIGTGGSPRLFFRCRKGSKSYIAVYDRRHRRDYLKLQRHLTKASVAVPEVYRVHDDLLITEDLGRRSLLRLARGNPGRALPYYKKAIKELIRFQVNARPGAPVGAYYDARHIAWEQKYFKRFFLNQYLKIPLRAIRELDPVFLKLGQDVKEAIRPISGFLMHRDYQSTNILIRGSRVRIIDFQSARIGPLTYDLAALLRDPYVNIPAKTEGALVDYYLRAVRTAAERPDIDERQFKQAYRLCALQRLLQALGAFANLSLNRGKPHFGRYIGRGARSLTRSLRGSDYEKILAVMQSHG
jgi:aminoglycoside/choline kinase family phosphotransferase